jgi:hypothetical protein
MKLLNRHFKATIILSLLQMIVHVNVSAQNLISNPGFEEGKTEWPSLWTRDANSGNAEIASEPVYSGDSALQIVHWGSQDWALNTPHRIPVRPGQIYEFSAWIHVSQLAGSVEIGVSTLDSNKQTIEWVFEPEALNQTNNEYEKILTRLTVPDDIYYVLPRFVGYASCNLFLDDVEFVLVDSVTPPLTILARVTPQSDAAVFEGDTVKLIIHLPDEYNADDISFQWVMNGIEMQSAHDTLLTYVPEILNDNRTDTVKVIARFRDKTEQRVWLIDVLKRLENMIVIRPREYSRPLRNPLKGFTTSEPWGSNEWATLQHQYIRWNEIENDSSDGIEKIKNWCDRHFKTVRKGIQEDVDDYNVKIIPRVYLNWPPDGNYWPADMIRGDYSSPQFLGRVERLVERLGQCWDNDPRIAFVEMGIIGQWGEQHSPSVTTEMEEVLGKAFRSAFVNKKVLVRQPWDFTEYAFGVYWDSWAHYDQMTSHGKGIEELGERWKQEIMGGEVAYDWGNYRIQPGDDPTDTMIDPDHRSHLINTIRELHCTQLRWVSEYDESNIEAATRAEEVQKAFGYRFVIREFRFPSILHAGDPFEVSFSVQNTGSAPFYCNWPVELSLLDEGRNLVWSEDFDSVDIREWFPGAQWDGNSQSYQTQARTYQATGAFHLDEDIRPGRYIMTLAVLDPAGRLPSLRFAIQNHHHGGRHPIAYVGIDTVIHGFEMDSTRFDDPYLDTTMHYIYDPDETPIIQDEKSQIKNPRLYNYPNPFNPITNIGYTITEKSRIKIVICDILGKEVKVITDEIQQAGNYRIVWDGNDKFGRNVTSGVYFCMLTSGHTIKTIKLVFIK